MNKQHKIALTIPTLIVVILGMIFLACAPIGKSGCGTLWIVCPDDDYENEFCVNCQLIDTALNDTILYFRFKDCHTGKTLQSSVGADCTVEER